MSARLKPTADSDCPAPAAPAAPALPWASSGAAFWAPRRLSACQYPRHCGGAQAQGRKGRKPLWPSSESHRNRRSCSRRPDRPRRGRNPLPPAPPHLRAVERRTQTRFKRVLQGPCSSVLRLRGRSLGRWAIPRSAGPTRTNPIGCRHLHS